MSRKLIKHEANIGDIDIYSDSYYVQVTVDSETVLFFAKDDEHESLKAFTNALNKIIGD